MDQDGSLNISYDEWRDYLLYAPTANIHELINYWRHSTVRFYNFYFAHKFIEILEQYISSI